MSRTLVAFHAHPDDEALLTAGTMARAAAEGHRVVLVLATDGGAGLAAPDLRGGDGLGALRLQEARASAQALGVHRVEWLGYADSGSGPEPEPDLPGLTRFCRAPLEEAAERLAAVLRTERADVPAADHSMRVPASAPLSQADALAIVLEATLEWVVREIAGNRQS